ncbi:hypothetical protein TSO352_12480 [Azospirillum sp. TSO35-2]|nr:hypothetical protein TSO352_12480 [Azospirillum sp. TSO35-2]
MATVDLVAWDDFAQRCRASFPSAGIMVRLNRLRGRVLAMEFFLDQPDGPDRKIGQCALAIRGAKRIFLDSLILAPGCKDFWHDCFALAIATAGPGHYRYGSNWTVETDYPGKILAIPGVVPTGDVGGYQDVVDFRRWASFEEYVKGVSANIRRNVAAVEKMSEPPRIEEYRGLAIFRAMHHLSLLRRAVLAKRGVRINLVTDYLARAVKIVIFRRYARMTLLRHGGKVHSVFYGIAYGPTLHYNAGATLPEINGLGPYMFIHLIRRWFGEHPDGRLLMGFVDGRGIDDKDRSGPLLFRQKLRAMSCDGGPFGFDVVQIRPTSHR